MGVKNIDLTATEIGYLWSTFQTETLNHCMLTYFDRIAEDPEIKELNAKTLETSTNRIKHLKEIFNSNDFPIPIGFTDSDVMKTVERLYTDPFILYFQWFVGKGSMNFGSLAINTIARDDVFEFYEKFIMKGIELISDSRKMLLSKGLWIRAPYIPIPKEVEFVKEQSYLGGWLGEQRPLAGIEVASLFYNIITNTLGLAIMNSFIQTTENKEIRDHFIRGKSIAEKQIQVLSKVLKENDLPVPTTWNTGVTGSKKAPFSEKLMMFLTSFINAQGLSNYGNAISNTIRRDIGLDFTRLAAEIAEFGEDGMKIIIKNGWMEMPPHAKKPMK